MKNSTKLLATLAAVIVACAAFTPRAQAVLINGGISLGGGFTVNTGNINTSTAFTSFFNVFAVNVSGDYSAVPTGGSSPVMTMSTFAFNPFAGPIAPLWTFTSGGLTYSFDLGSASIVTQGHNALVLVGSGTLNMTGFDPTPGDWVFTANQGGHTFSFSSSNGSVPEGGSALILLGLSLVAVEALRRKLASA